MRADRFSRRLKWWWQAAEDYVMRPQEDSMDVDTQPLPVKEGFLDFDAPDYRPVDVTVPKRTPESLMLELLAALHEDGLH